MTQQVVSVSEVNDYIRNYMDSDRFLSGLAVRGEISNLKTSPTKHKYFTLKDETTALKCVMFRSSAEKLKFYLDNGMKVIATGKISVYPRDGAYQLYCTNILPEGIGELHVAFEQLKRKLAAQGLFDQDHKKPIPQYPGTIGLVTSGSGAAVHDMIRILRKRFPITKVRVFPVRVQGTEAPGEIAAAIAYANHFRLADLLIVGRGGGSLEDLWAFNEEQVARAIYNSRIPVISAVGHQPDVTISDFVADLSAATPSNAAELAVPDQDALRQTLDSIAASMAGSLHRQVKNARKQLDILSSRPSLQSPTQYLEQRRKTLALMENRLCTAHTQILNRQKHLFLTYTSKLDAMSPLKVLTRGYAMVQTGQGTVLRSVHQVNPGDQLAVTISDGVVNTTVMDAKENVQ